MTAGQWYARLATVVVVRSPRLWRVFRSRLTTGFDRLAPEWDTTRASPSRLDVINLALDAVEDPPATILDVGTGTGADVSEGMIAEAQRQATGRQRFVVADASALPFDDGAFELVALNNMIPFFDELARVTAPGGRVAIAYSRGRQTPIWVPLDRVRRELAAREFTHFADFSAGEGRSLLARKADRA